MEAEALGAAAAADKGVKLSPEALAKYAAAIDGEAWQQDGGDSQHKPPDERRHDEQGKEAPPSIPELQKKIEESCAPGEQSVPSELDLLNRLPGKNGQRWIVIPFTFTGEDVAYSVCIRLLLKDNAVSNGSGRLIADIITEDRRWRFNLERLSSGASRLTIRLWPAVPEREFRGLKKRVKKELSGLTADCSIINGGGIPSLAEELGTIVLPSVNEEV
jgi:hypothetical protein